MKRGRKRSQRPARSAADSDDCMQQLFEAAVKERLKKSGQVSARAPARLVCLVDSSFMDHAVARLLQRTPSIVVREASNLDGAALVLPARKQAFVLAGLDERDYTGPLDSDEALLHRQVTRGALFESDRAAVQSVASKFAHVSVLVINDLELSKYLTLEFMSDVRILSCHGPAEAAAYIEDCVPEPHQPMPVACGDAVATAIATLVPGMGAAHRLEPAQLLELLAGRTSDGICQEHYGWSLDTARRVQEVLRKDQVLREP